MQGDSETVNLIIISDDDCLENLLVDTPNFFILIFPKFLINHENMGALSLKNRAKQLVYRYQIKAPNNRE